MDAARTRPNNSEALSAKGFVPTLLHASLMQVVLLGILITTSLLGQAAISHLSDEPMQS